MSPKIKLTHISQVHPNHDTLSIFDGDGREIAIRQKDIDQLIRLLRIHIHATAKEVLQYARENIPHQ